MLSFLLHNTPARRDGSLSSHMLRFYPRYIVGEASYDVARISGWLHQGCGVCGVAQFPLLKVFRFEDDRHTVVSYCRKVHQAVSEVNRRAARLHLAYFVDRLKKGQNFCDVA